MMAGVSNPEINDIQAKYQKLATEYSKLRAQNKVLKNGVIEEQNKVFLMKENLKLKDQTLRKADQELDSLTFRNQQLSKRLSLLQDDLEAIQIKGSKNSSHENEANGILQDSVFAEELQGKIQENARLHARIAELEESHMIQLSELEDRYALLKQEFEKIQESQKRSESSYKEKISQLENGQVMLEVTAQQKTIEMRSIQEKLIQLETSGMTPNHSSPDEIKPNLKLNLKNERKDKSEEILSVRDLVSSLEEPFCNLSSGFKGLLNSYVNILNQTDSYETQVKILKDEEVVWGLLEENYKLFKADTSISNSIKEENLKKVSIITKSITKCASSLKKLLPILSKRFDDTGGKYDASWKSSFGRFVSSWASIIPSLTTIATTDLKGEDAFQNSIIKNLALLGERVEKVKNTSEELVTAWGPTDCDIFINLKKVAESILQIHAIQSKILVILNTHCKTPSTPSSLDITPVNVAEASTTSPTQSVGAWSENSGDCAGQGSESSLSQQLEQAISRLSKLEEEKEHWRLEYQLLSHRRQNDTKNNTSNNTDIENNDNVRPLSTSVIGEISSVTSSPEDREKEIRAHFTERCKLLYMQHTGSTSQAALYQNECDSILKRLTISEELKVAAEEDAQLIKQQLVELQENLLTTSRNYEEQISTMSEHLADLNEELTAKQDTIEQLLYQHKMVKKSKK